MDFSKVLRFIIDDFNRENVRYGLIGGFAMGAWGIMKSTIRVILPEDIIGLKVQAAVNEASRESLEYSDIQLITERFREKLNWVLLKDYFELFNMGKRYEEFKEKYCPSE